MSFTVNLLPTPVPTPPVARDDGAMFQWSYINQADSYDLWVDDLTANKSQFIRNSNLTAMSYFEPNVISGHTYRWLVRSLSNTGNYSLWSAATILTILPTPVPLITIQVPQSVTFTWQPVVGANYYDVWINDVTAGVIQLIRNTHVVGASLSASGLTVGHTYTWSVRAFSNSGNYSFWTPQKLITV